MSDPIKTSAISIPLPRLAEVLLFNALEQPGWATTPRHHGCAYVLLEEVLSVPNEPKEIKEQPRPQTQREMRTLRPDWCLEILMLDLTERQRDTIKDCLTALRNRGALPPGWATFALLQAFGLDADT